MGWKIWLSFYNTQLKTKNILFTSFCLMKVVQVHIIRSKLVATTITKSMWNSLASKYACNLTMLTEWLSNRCILFCDNIFLGSIYINHTPSSWSLNIPLNPNQPLSIRWWASSVRWARKFVTWHKTVRNASNKRGACNWLP